MRWPWDYINSTYTLLNGGKGRLTLIVENQRLFPFVAHMASVPTLTMDQLKEPVPVAYEARLDVVKAAIHHMRLPFCLVKPVQAKLIS